MAQFNIVEDLDDAYKRNGTWRATGRAEVAFGLDISLETNAGWRYLGINIPKGSTITSAKLTFKAYGEQSGLCNVKIYAEKSTNPAQWIGEADFNSRSLTTENVSWTVPAHIDNDMYDTPDFSDVVQEIVDQGGWVSGNAIVIRMHNDTGSVSYRRVEAYYNGTLVPAVLTITWTLPAGAAEVTLNPNAFTGYHCFREQFQKRRAAGLIPYKQPNGTLYRDAPSG